MVSLKVERDINAAPEVVWAIIADLDRSSQVVSGILKVERLDDGAAFGVGTRWNETRKMFGRQATELLEVTKLDAGRSYTVEADGPGVHYTTVMAVSPKDDGAVLSMSFEGKATSTVAKIGAFFGRLFAGSMEKLIKQDLDDIAAAAEQTSAP